MPFTEGHTTDMRRVRNKEFSSALNISPITVDTKHVAVQSLDLVAKV